METKRRINTGGEERGNMEVVISDGSGSWHKMEIRADEAGEGNSCTVDNFR